MVDMLRVVRCMCEKQVQAVLLAPVCPHVCEHIWELAGEVKSLYCVCV